MTLVWKGPKGNEIGVFKRQQCLTNCSTDIRGAIETPPCLIEQCLHALTVPYPEASRGKVVYWCLFAPSDQDWATKQMQNVRWHSVGLELSFRKLLLFPSFCEKIFCSLDKVKFDFKILINPIIKIQQTRVSDKKRLDCYLVEDF